MSTQLLFRPEDYNNQLSQYHLTSTDIQRQVVSYPLTFLREWNSEVEYKISFPAFVIAFYDFIYKNKRVPSQQQFFDYYITFNHDYFTAAKFSQYIINCLKARVFRSYPTLVREFHFNKLLTEKAPEYKIVYNDYLDIKHDIDTLLIRDGQYWAACLYTKTKRALQARDLKETRHQRFSNVHYIEFPVNFDNKRKLGDFFLYGKQEMKILFDRINQGIPL